MGPRGPRSLPLYPPRLFIRDLEGSGYHDMETSDTNCVGAGSKKNASWPRPPSGIPMSYSGHESAQDFRLGLYLSIPHESLFVVTRCGSTQGVRKVRLFSCMLCVVCQKETQTMKHQSERLIS